MLLCTDRSQRMQDRLKTSFIFHCSIKKANRAVLEFMAYQVVLDSEVQLVLWVSEVHLVKLDSEAH